MNNVGITEISFGDYLECVKQIGTINPQERNYQYFTIEFLKKILIDTGIQVIDVSTNRNTKIHNRDHYTGDRGTPDILLARGYQYNNNYIDEASVDYIAVIEVKTPLEKMDETKLIEHHKKQLLSHLSKNEKVILTDCITWCFFRDDKLDQKADVLPIKSFEFRNEFYKNKRDKHKEVQKVGKRKEAFNMESDSMGSSFNELQQYIKEFIHR
ncbi:hypothetical protein HXA35_20000 [Bacillus sp. A301a_S52]|nr:hypothetical protein [Bacillus sp. A301a_S52]